MSTQFNRECLEAHNEYRKKHGAPPLVLSAKICQYSQNWAQTLANRDCGRYGQWSLSHSNYHAQGYGENCAGALPDYNGRKPAQMWYDEIKYYRFGYNNSFSPQTGHFTQVVWKNSKELGVGRAVARSGNVYVVANYSPPGNYAGQFSANVLPLGTQPPPVPKPAPAPAPAPAPVAPAPVKTPPAAPVQTKVEPTPVETQDSDHEDEESDSESQESDQDSWASDSQAKETAPNVQDLDSDAWETLSESCASGSEDEESDSKSKEVTSIVNQLESVTVTSQTKEDNLLDINSLVTKPLAINYNDKPPTEVVKAVFERRLGNCMGDRMHRGYHLGVNQYLMSQNGQYIAILQEDGNFVVYDKNAKVYFASNTYRKPCNQVQLRNDGRFTVVDKSNLENPFWISHKGVDDGECFLIMQDDGNLVAYKGQDKIDPSLAYFSAW